MTHVHHRYLNTTWCQPNINAIHNTAMWCQHAQADVDKKQMVCCHLNFIPWMQSIIKQYLWPYLEALLWSEMRSEEASLQRSTFLHCNQITWLSGFSLLLNNTPQQVSTWPTWFGLICYVFALILGKWKQQVERLAHQAGEAQALERKA